MKCKLIKPGQVQTRLSNGFFMAGPEFNAKYGINTLKNGPVLFQRQKNTFPDRPTGDTRFTGIKRWRNQIKLLQIFFGYIISWFSDRDEYEYKYGFGNPYFDYYIGHARMTASQPIAVELKDAKSEFTQFCG